MKLFHCSAMRQRLRKYELALTSRTVSNGQPPAVLLFMEQFRNFIVARLLPPSSSRLWSGDRWLLQ